MNDEQNHYCRNLIEVNKQQAVITSQAIYNDQGVLLLAKGADLNEKRAQVLLQHKLMLPLEHCVGIASSLDAQQLFDLLNKFAHNIPVLYAITHTGEYQKTLRQACFLYAKHSLLQQNLTVLALRIPDIYYQSIFCAMAGLAIAIKMGLGIREQHHTFIAGLFHDVGFLYLAPELRAINHSFNNDEWRAMQAHPLVAKRFMDMITALPPDIGLAIADHHERIDGTGYPRHIFGDKISIVSQIVAATDNIILNHNRYHTYGIHAHKMLLTALTLNDNIYVEPVYNAAMLLFKETPSPSEHLLQLPSIAHLLTRQQMLVQQFSSAKGLAQQLIIHSQHPLVRSINAVMGRLAISIVRSGILQPEQEQWLATMTDADSICEEISLLEMNVMHDQLHDQLIHLKTLMERVVESVDEDTPHFHDLIASLNRFDLHHATPA